MAPHPTSLTGCDEIKMEHKSKIELMHVVCILRTYRSDSYVFYNHFRMFGLKQNIETDIHQVDWIRCKLPNNQPTTDKDSARIFTNDIFTVNSHIFALSQFLIINHFSQSEKG